MISANHKALHLALLMHSVNLIGGMLENPILHLIAYRTSNDLKLGKSSIQYECVTAGDW